MAQGIKENEPEARVIYADIIGLPHWEPTENPRMSALERAAQFSPFAALTGYEDMVEEEAREVGMMKELTESELKILNQKLNLIYDVIEDGHHPVLTFTYFVNDENKNGGSYVSITERVRNVDTVRQKVRLYRKTGVSGSYMELDIDKIKEISGELVDFIG